MIIVMMIGFYVFARHVSHFLFCTYTLLTHILFTTALKVSTSRGKLPLETLLSINHISMCLCVVGASVQEAVPLEDRCA